MSDDTEIVPKHKLRHKGTVDIDINWGWGGFAFVGLIFFWFWAQHGWYRVDCAIKVQAACDLIQAEYGKDKKP